MSGGPHAAGVPHGHISCLACTHERMHRYRERYGIVSPIVGHDPANCFLCIIEYPQVRTHNGCVGAGHPLCEDKREHNAKLHAEQAIRNQMLTDLPQAIKDSKQLSLDREIGQLRLD